jgi:hypothetical protein
MLVRRPVAFLLVLARCEREPQPLHIGTRGGRGPGVAHRTGQVAHGEPVPVLGVRLEVAGVDVHRMGQRRLGAGCAVGDDVVEVLVRGHLPGDRDRSVRHAAVIGQRLGHQAGPEDHRVRQWIAGGDAQCEQ